MIDLYQNKLTGEVIDQINNEIFDKNWIYMGSTESKELADGVIKFYQTGNKVNKNTN